MAVDMLSNIRIVLIGTSHPGNIGAVARAMKNMCLTSLYLVQPKIFPSAEATARASGADDILAHAVVCQDLPAALRGCRWVIGASARARTLSWPMLDARDAAKQALGEGRQHPVAIVFGREHSGLTNEELEYCHAQLLIPGNPEYMSLNIAAAVQIVAYEIRMAASTEGEVDDRPVVQASEALATVDEMDLFYDHLEKVMIETGFLNPQQPKRLLQRLRRLYNRARPDKNEINILRGILTAVEEYHHQA
jgi:tRNA (cytidine32/uridine32-2'-O)-methyltransferase